MRSKSVKVKAYKNCLATNIETSCSMNMHLKTWLLLFAIGFPAISSQAEFVGEPQDIELNVSNLCHDVIFWEQTNANLYGVKIIWGGQKVGEKEAHPSEDIRNIQVWLLQPDGTCIPQNSEPAIFREAHFGMMYDNVMIFTFTRTPTNRVDGIVLRYRGKLYCKEIEPTK